MGWLLTGELIFLTVDLPALKVTRLNLEMNILDRCIEATADSPRSASDLEMIHSSHKVSEYCQLTWLIQCLESREIGLLDISNLLGR